MKLELKHLAPYLPYGLKMTTNAKGKTAYITTIKRRLKNIEVLTPELIEVMLFLKRKPILRPLSDLTKQNKIDGKVFVPLKIIQLHNNVDIDSDGIVTDGKDHYGLHWLAYESMLFLFKWHFDVFGLIEKGLAIDINTLNK